ncbi:Arsenate reductase and related proteins, glutaredoxin family [Delftia tsuruhatensis]|uniref:MBL fold metallo-hydrolase n=1 Tax=Delftia tsuruhatensis TaxID=180282 RepID=UPI001E805F79|nr:MBL fold metallo-hydrolase [Delftia tsuruhatensis]CAB5708442.1 Arsenate reductase and related proteins, glutaredoxin family [Delftia tsuruhatensis]CAC9680740.1 Arsenate reductase and related proteins, glutaredoxin family [Delftia tsuruhatensis]
MLRTTLLSLTLALSAGLSQAQTAAPLQMKVYQADEHSFAVTSTLITGPREAVVVDTGFTRADGLRIAANVLDSGKQLTTILVSNADPDYYFGAEVLKNLFPQAKVVATPAVREKIEAKLQGKLAFWGPKMGANAPSHPVLPEPLTASTLTVDGQTLELRGTTGALAHRPYVWVPSLRAIVGNVGVFGNLHVWTADTQKPAERQAWLAQLDEMQALKPSVVVPGHMQAGTAMDASAIAYTRSYLQRFDAAAASARNSGELIEAMKQAYPQAGMALSLDIGAKVNKGEMPW